MKELLNIFKENSNGMIYSTNENEYKNYKKAGTLLLPTEVTRNVGGQEIPFIYKDIKLNEGVTDADFK